MSSVNGIGGNAPINRTAGIQTPVMREVNQTQTERADKLELSGASPMMAKLRANDIRADKVAEVRKQIDDGTYETDDKLNVAVSRLMDDLDL